MRVYGTVDRNVSISPRFPDGGACRGYACMSDILNVQRFSVKYQQRPASRDVHFFREKKNDAPQQAVHNAEACLKQYVNDETPPTFALLVPTGYWPQQKSWQ